MIGVGIAVPVIIGVVAGLSDDDGGSSGSGSYSDIETTLLDEAVLADALEEAARTERRESDGQQGQRVQAIEVRVDEYAIRVTFYDPNADQLRTYEKNDYDPESYTVRVEENYYDNYVPRPFYLDELDAGVLVEVSEEALAAADDPYSFSTTAEVDPDAEELRIRADVSDEDSDDVELVTDAAGTPVAG